MRRRQLASPPVAAVLALAAALVATTGAAAASDGARGPRAVAVDADSVGRAATRLVERPRGYRVVIRDLLAWHRTRHNGCAAFVTSALARVGFVVPDERPDGPWSNPARVTFSLDDFLARAGWARIDDERALAAGDVVFTTGAPDHVMLFHGWADPHARIALVSDNQRRRYRRPFAPPAASDVAGFGFARRAPMSAPAVPASR